MTQVIDMEEGGKVVKANYKEFDKIRSYEMGESININVVCWAEFNGLESDWSIFIAEKYGYYTQIIRKLYVYSKGFELLQSKQFHF